MARADLSRLAFKYRVLADLRGRREELERQGISRFDGPEGATRRARFKTLAAEFPGCLRELDVRPARALAARADALAAAIGGGPVEPWMEVTAAYHATLREALAVKRWLAERFPRGGAIDAACLSAFGVWHAAWPNAHGALPEANRAAFLERHLRPPGGRLHALVWAALQERFDRSVAELEGLVFTDPVSPSE